MTIEYVFTILLSHINYISIIYQSYNKRLFKQNTSFTTIKMDITDRFIHRYEWHNNMINFYKILMTKTNFEIVYYFETEEHDGYTKGSPDGRLYDLVVLYKINKNYFIDQWHMESWYYDEDYLEEFELQTIHNINRDSFYSIINTHNKNISGNFYAPNDLRFINDIFSQSSDTIQLYAYYEVDNVNVNLKNIYKSYLQN